jgi:hypothetical protein
MLDCIQEEELEENLGVNSAVPVIFQPLLSEITN